MNKEKLYTKVAAAVKLNKNVDKNKLAVQLMTEGATLALVNRELPKALAANGIIAPAGAMVAVNKHITDKLEGWKIKTYPDVVARAEKVAEKFKIDNAKAIKAIRKAIGEGAPSRPKLGATKQGIVDYISSYDTPTITGLAKYLEKECKLAEDKALQSARMNFAFAMACYKAK